MTDLERMAREAGFVPVEEAAMPWRAAGWAPNFARFADLIRAVERERCAALVQRNALACEPGSMLQVYLASNAAAIRKGGAP